MNTPVKPNFIYPEISVSDRVFGASITGPILRENGDWRDFLPQHEDQNVRGIESSACYVEAQQACIATILEAQYGIKDSNFASRFNALLSKGTPLGGDPVKGAKSIKYDGLIPESMMGWNSLDSWEDFHSWKGSGEIECRRAGKNFLSKWRLDFRIIVERDMKLETKYEILREWLKRSPIPISVAAWFEKDGEYYKPEGMRDNHLTLAAYYLDEKNQIHVRDTYSPYTKVLSPNTDFEFAISWAVNRIEEKRSLFSGIINFIKLLLKWY